MWKDLALLSNDELIDAYTADSCIMIDFENGLNDLADEMGIDRKTARKIVMQGRRD